MSRHPVPNRLHWSTSIAVVCTFWFLLYFLLTIMLLIELTTLPEGHGKIELYTPFFVLFGLLTLWTGYKGWKRLQLLRHGRLIKATLTREKYEDFDPHSGLTTAHTRFHYRFKVNDEWYRKTSYWAYHRKRKGTLEVIYDVTNPKHNEPAFHLPVYFDHSQNMWRATYWRVVPRLTGLAAVFAWVAFG